MEQVLFLNSNEAFPFEFKGMIYSPRPVVGGFVFSLDKKDICDLLGVEYVLKHRSDIEDLPYKDVDEIFDDNEHQL